MSVQDHIIIIILRPPRSYGKFRILRIMTCRYLPFEYDIYYILYFIVYHKFAYVREEAKWTGVRIIIITRTYVRSPFNGAGPKINWPIRGDHFRSPGPGDFRRSQSLARAVMPYLSAY